jgi:hypothetical protein
MVTCSKCATAFAGRVCPNCGASPALTRQKANRLLIKYSYAVLAGLLGILVADHYFPLLDRNAFLITGMCVLFAPVIFHVISSARGRLGVDLCVVQRAYLVAGVASVLLALLIAGNGWFDRSAATPVMTTMIRKQVVRGRSGPSYTLKVRSWRPGKTTESLGVGAPTYRNASVEKAIVVEMHRGAFGMPWYSGVFSE